MVVENINFMLYIFIDSLTVFLVQEYTIEQNKQKTLFS